MERYHSETKYLKEEQPCLSSEARVQVPSMRAGKLKQCWASAVSAMGVMVAGAASSWLQPITARLRVDPDLGLSEDDISWLMATIEISCFFSPLIAGKLADRFGRKIVILSIGPLCFLGWLVVLLWKSLEALHVMRLLHGLALGIAFTVQPIYTAEITEPKLRGKLSGIFQISFYVGIIYIFSLGPFLSLDNLLYASLIPPGLFTFMFMFCPDTPYFYLMKGRETEAEGILRMFRGLPHVGDELSCIKEDIREQTREKSSWKTLLKSKFEMKALLILQITCLARYFTGGAVIVNYASETFSRSDSFLPPAEMSLLLAATMTIIAALSSCLADCLGRKPLLLASCFGSSLALYLTSLYYFLHEKTSVDAGPYTWTLYLGLVMYCFFSGIGLGPLLQTLQAEMFGANTRGLAGGITQGFGAFWCFVILKIYYSVNEYFGLYFNFCMYGTVSLVCGLLLTCLMYETAGTRIGQTGRPKCTVDA